MRCPACNHENRDAARFCEACAAPLERACARCGSRLRATAKFCDTCGSPLRERPIHAGDPRSYTPSHLAEKILTCRSALEGEHKQVTVLFADVKDSMELAERLDPEEWHRILDRFFQILTDGVHRFEGTVNQYTGDGIMALFGAPIAHEDHAQRACYAALQVVRALRDYAIELRRARGLDFSVRVGMNSGEVVVGRIGDDLRMDYTAQGHVVGLAARMESLAEPGKVYLTSDTAERVKGYFELEDLGPFRVKGAHEPVRVFSLAGIGRLRTNFDVARARGLTRFVGRAGDMRVLEAALDSARSGKGCVVGIVASAGLGKSRLCFEFAEHCQMEGLTVLYGRALAHGKNIPLVPILEVFRAYFGIKEGDAPQLAREKIAGRLLLIDEHLRDALPIVFDFLGVLDPARTAPSLHPEARQRRIVAVIRRVVERGTRGFLIVIEDLHWLDPASEALVAAFVDAIPHGAGLLVLTFRPPYHADWMERSWYEQLPLGPLGPAAARELLHALLGDDPSVAELADRIQERAQGNPFFTEEIVRALADSGRLVGSRGGYRLERPAEPLQVPDSVQAVLSARIDRLPERDKRVLEAAAVIGLVFAEPTLAAVSALSAADLAAALAALSEAEFIYQRALYPITEYAFAHALAQEVALASQLGEQRRRMHAAVARALQESGRDDLGARSAVIAQHFEESGSQVDASRWHARAALWAGTRDFPGAIRHWQRVWDLARSLPEAEQSHETRELELAASMQIVLAGWRLGSAEPAEERVYEEGCKLAERLRRADTLANLCTAHASFVQAQGRIREASAAFAEGIRAAAEAGDKTTRVAAHLGRMSNEYLLGRLASALAMAEEGRGMVGSDLQLGRDIAGFSFAVFFVGMKALACAMLGRCGEAVDTAVEAHRLSVQSEAPENLGWSYCTIGTLSAITGDTTHATLGDARVCGQEAVRIADETGSTFSRVFARTVLGAVHATLGHWAEAERAASEALRLARERRAGLEWETHDLTYVSRAALGLGDAARARALAEEAIRLGEARGQRVLVQQYAVLAHALCAEHGPRARTAVENALHAAVASVAETGARGVEPLIPEAYAELDRVCGDGAAHERHLREAHRMYAAIGAHGHAERVQALLRAPQQGA